MTMPVYIKEQLGSDTKDMLDPLLASFHDDLEFRLNGFMATAYLKGQVETITWGKTKGGIPIAYEGPPISKAITWAEKHGATLVTQMDEETKRRLAHTISQGIQNKRGIPGLARDIKKDFADMTRYRSQLIARTETANALSQASLDTMADMGIEGKEWVTAGDDLVSDECLANEAEGPIPVGQTFSGGVSAPPQHPDCRCALAPSRVPTEKVPAEPTITKPPPTPKAPPGVSQTTQDFMNNKVKVTGKKTGDISGLNPTLKAIEKAKLPDSHLNTVRSIQINAAKVQARTRGSMAYTDGANNIVLAGKVGPENVIHEIGHTFWNKRVFVPDKVSKVKWDIADVFNAAEKTSKGFVSSYARTNVDEFFAESYAAFAQNPSAFAKLNPSMAKILKGLWKW